MMGRIDELERRVKDLEDEIGRPTSGRPGFDPGAAHVSYSALYEGPYGYGSQDR